MARLGVKAAHVVKVGYTLDAQNAGGKAEADLVFLGNLASLVVGFNDHAVESFKYHFFGPLITHAVLYPLEVGDHRRAGIA